MCRRHSRPAPCQICRRNLADRLRRRQARHAAGDDVRTPARAVALELLELDLGAWLSVDDLAGAVEAHSAIRFETARRAGWRLVRDLLDGLGPRGVETRLETISRRGDTIREIRVVERLELEAVL